MRHPLRWSCAITVGLAVAVLVAAVWPGPARRPPPAPAQAGDGAALVIAERFTEQWWSARWTDGPGALAGRVASTATPALLAHLSGAAGAPTLSSVVDGEQRSVSVADPVAVVVDRPGAGLGVAVTATATVRSRAREATGTVSLEVLVVPTRGGWRVAEVDQ